MLFAQIAPRKGLAHEYGAQELLQDIRKLGNHEAILKCDGELTLRNTLEEVSAA